MALAISRQQERDGSAVLALEGEIDIAQATRLEDAVACALRETSSVEVDLSEVTFVDAAGLSALLRCRQGARANGGRCSMTSPSRPVRRLVRLTRTQAALGLTCVSEPR